MELLSADSLKFVSKIDTMGGGTFVVGSCSQKSEPLDFKRIITAIKHQLIDSVVEEKFGSSTTRVLRILRDKVILDDKTVCASSQYYFPHSLCHHPWSRLHLLIVSFSYPKLHSWRRKTCENAFICCWNWAVWWFRFDSHLQQPFINILAGSAA